MAKKNITIDEPAKMVQKGFEETAKKADVNKRFDKIENILLKQQGERIESLEKRLSRLEDALAMK